jgi:hypothetical protein
MLLPLQGCSANRIEKYMKAYRSFVVLGLPLFMLQACAYQPSQEVTSQMARTETTIQQAERSGVAATSLPELQAAKDKYSQAKTLLQKESHEADQMALQLAKQAEVDAQYATAKANSAKQATSAREVQSGVDALKSEAAHNASTPTTASP